MKLTPEIIRKAIKGDNRIDQNIDFDEPGKAIVYLTDGYTFDPLDGNRSVEGFVLADNYWTEPDTVGYLRRVLKSIEPIKN